MATGNDLLNHFEAFAPLETQMDFDNAGFLVGDINAEINRVLITLDITSEVVHNAHDIGADLILSHHPVIFRPIKNLYTNTVPYQLAKYGISALCMHTNVDLAEIDGINFCLAQAIGLQNIKVDTKNCFAYGSIQETDAENFAKHVKKSLNCDGLRFTDIDKKIKKVVVSGGAGGDLIFNLPPETDAFVTGEIKHHELLYAAENNIVAVDASHRRTEEIFKQAMQKRLSKSFPEVEFIVSCDKNDRMKYI